MRIGIFDDNECNFAVQVANDVNIEQVKELLKAGLGAWYQAANEDIEPNEYFNQDDIESFYWSGYSEPSCELLTRFNIPYEDIDILYDDNGNPSNIDIVVNY